MMWWAKLLPVLKSRWLPWSLLLVSVALGTLSTVGYNWEKVSRQNAEAALDTTRSISTKQGEVYARLLAQKDVELSGALATAARLRRLKPVVQVGITTLARDVDTNTHHRRLEGRVDSSGVVRDSLVLTGPPIDGSVTVAVSDSTIYWAAKLRPSPVPLSVSLGCGKSGPELTASGPDWVETTISTGQVDPKVCNPPGSKFWTGVKVGGAATVIVVGALLIIF